MQDVMGGESSLKQVYTRIIDVAARSAKQLTCEGCGQIKSGDHFREVCRVNLSDHSYMNGRFSIAIHSICNDCYPSMISWCSRHKLYSKHLVKFCENTLSTLSSNRVKYKRTGTIVGIDTIDLVYTYLKQNGLCALTGLPMDLSAKGSGGGFSRISRALTAPSLDMVIADGPLLVGNIRWVLVGIAHMKDGLSQEQFIKLCSRVTEYDLAKQVG